MGFRINTNIGAMNAHMSASMNNRELDNSLSRLSSGLRINKAADDASGMTIANSLRAQSKGLGQAITNANDGIAVAQTADGALDEYSNIIQTVRTKSIQAASDGQSADSRKAIQSDINKLLEEAQNIASTTSFNGQKLLDGSYQNKSFQIGAYANETVAMSVSSTQTNAIGAFASVTGATVAGGAVAVTANINGSPAAASAADTATGANTVAHSAGSAWAIKNAINAISTTTGVTATASTTFSSTAVAGGALAAGGITINGKDIGAVAVSANDSDGSLMNAINAISNQTGVTATNVGGKMILSSTDGSDITIAGTDGGTIGGLGANATHGGTITLESDKAITTTAAAGFTAVTTSVANALNSVDVTSRTNAQKAIKTADSALKAIDTIRSGLGSVQNQLDSTIRNISVTQVNVASAESQIRDVDFAAESANFSKRNILAQSGSYAMSQANAVQQNVLRLLQ